MADYIKATNFAAKDALPTGNSAKRILGTEIDTEFTAIQAAVNSKADEANPTFTGNATGVNLALSGTLGVTGNTTTENLTVNGSLTVDDACYLSVRRSGAAQVSGNIVLFNTEDIDNKNAYDPATGAFTAPTAGKYLVIANIDMSNSTGSANNAFMAVLKNGSFSPITVNHRRENGTQSTHSFGGVVDLAAGDYIQIVDSITPFSASRTISSFSSLHVARLF
jgi:hypothetical protein